MNQQRINESRISGDRLVTSNGTPEGNEFVALYDRVLSEENEKKSKWIEQLRSQQIKAAHDDTGWVDRKNNWVTMMYPNFLDDDLKVGDSIALGDYRKHRIVRVTEITRSWMGNLRLSFEGCEVVKEYLES